MNLFQPIIFRRGDRGHTASGGGVPTQVGCRGLPCSGGGRPGKTGVGRQSSAERGGLEAVPEPVAANARAAILAPQEPPQLRILQEAADRLGGEDQVRDGNRLG